MSQWPQTSSPRFGRMKPPLDGQPGEQDTHFMDPTTQTASPVISDVELTKHITPLDRMDEENQYILVVTTSIRQLNLGTANDDLGESVTASPGKDAYQNPHVAAFWGANKKGHQPSRHDCGRARRHHGPHGVN